MPFKDDMYVYEGNCESLTETGGNIEFEAKILKRIIDIKQGG